MSNLVPGNQKHLTLNERLYIESALNEGESFRDNSLAGKGVVHQNSISFPHSGH